MNVQCHLICFKSLAFGGKTILKGLGRSGVKIKDLEAASRRFD